MFAALLKHQLLWVIPFVLDVTVALAARTCSGYRIYSFNLRGGDSPLLILCHKTVIYLCNINLEEKK
ncbi:hypothetical protein CEQ36_15465 [Yersinia intermedia]|nr:hypothetical protein A6J67_23030 [Yersinia sp. FDAARGOS_228]AVL36864.1 hypothetical protein CEQ36_15465 [Yersinia intermedia]